MKPNHVRGLIIQAAAAAVNSKPKRQLQIRLPVIDDYRAKAVKVRPNGPVQAILERATTQFILDKIQEIDGSKPAFTEALPDSALDGLASSLYPYDKSSLDELRQILGGLEYPTPEVRDSILDQAGSGSAFLTNLIVAVNTRIFAELLHDHVFNYPILLYLSSGNVRLASSEKFTAKGPRLSNLIEALRISYGSIMSDYNRFRLAEVAKKENPVDWHSLFPNEAMMNYTTIQAGLESLPAQATLVYGYLQHLFTLKSQLEIYCATHPEQVGVRKISASGEVLTDDPYLNTSADDIANITFKDLFVKEKRFKDLNLTSIQWDGTESKIEAIRIEPEDVYSKYIAVRDKTSIAKGMAAQARNINRARDFTAVQKSGKYISILQAALPASDKGVIADIYNSILGIITVSVSEANINPDLPPERMLPALSTLLDSCRIKIASKLELDERFKTLNVSSYHLNRAIATIFGELAMPITSSTYHSIEDISLLREDFNIEDPSTARNLRYLFISRPKSEKNVFDSHLVPTLKSGAFLNSYAANRANYESAVVAEPDKVQTVRDQVKALAADVATRIHLGIDDKSIRDMQIGVTTGLGGGGLKNLSAYVKSVFTKFTEMQQADPDTLLENTGARAHPEPAVIAYMADIVISPVLEEILASTSIAKAGLINHDAQSFAENRYKEMRFSAAGNTFTKNTIYGVLEIALEFTRNYPEKHVSLKTVVGNGAYLGYLSAIGADSAASMSEILRSNKESGSKPRNLEELAEEVRAFADPIPTHNINSIKGSMVRDTRPVKRNVLNISPGERISSAEAQGSGQSLPTVKSTLMKMIRRVFAGHMSIGAVKAEFEKRRQEILRLSTNYSMDITPFTIGGPIPFDTSPFIAESATPSESPIDFSQLQADLNRSEGLLVDSEKSEADRLIGSLGLSDAEGLRVRERLTTQNTTKLSRDELLGLVSKMVAEVRPKPASTVIRRGPGIDTAVSEATLAIESFVRAVETGAFSARYMPGKRIDHSLKPEFERQHRAMRTKRELLAKRLADGTLSSELQVKAKSLLERLSAADDIVQPILAGMESARPEVPLAEVVGLLRNLISDEIQPAVLKRIRSAVLDSPKYRSSPELQDNIRGMFAELFTSKNTSQLIDPYKAEDFVRYVNDGARSEPIETFKNFRDEVGDMRIREPGVIINRLRSGERPSILDDTRPDTEEIFEKLTDDD